MSADAVVLAGNAYHFLERKLRGIMFPVKSFIVATELLSDELADIRIDYAWGGTIGVPVNRVPQLGRLSPNIYYCQGYSGHGVNVTHLAGRIMADALAGTIEQFDLFANVKPLVVPGAYALSKPMLALGMLYYRIKDRL